jgi:hypothetical protein
MVHSLEQPLGSAAIGFNRLAFLGKNSLEARLD